MSYSCVRILTRQKMAGKTNESLNYVVHVHVLRSYVLHTDK